MSSKIFTYIEQEKQRQKEHLELIASENFVSENVLKAAGSILTNKYAEGYPNKRYYGGCEFVDKIELETIELAKILFNVQYANVQPHSGSSANLAVFKALLKHGDKIMSMRLDHGGHLTHGYAKNFSGQDYQAVFYGLDPVTEALNYNEIERLAIAEKPQLIIAGYSAYPLTVDFKRFKEIADEVGALFLVDMAHIAGLVATGLHPSPFPHADVVTSTTHKTLRGPRGGIILTNSKEIIRKVNSAIFPGIQGGPLMHIIAAKGIAFEEALQDSFVDYQKQIVANAKTMAAEFLRLGYKLIGNRTDNHLMLIDVKSSLGITGREAEQRLEQVNITCNKNSIPNDTESPMITSGIRIGTPAITTMGLKEKDCIEVVQLIHLALTTENTEEIKNRVIKIALK